MPEIRHTPYFRLILQGIGGLLGLCGVAQLVLAVWHSVLQPDEFLLSMAIACPVAAYLLFCANLLLRHFGVRGCKHLTAILTVLLAQLINEPIMGFAERLADKLPETSWFLREAVEIAPLIILLAFALSFFKLCKVLLARSGYPTSES